MKFVVFLDVDGVLNTRTTVERTPDFHTESMMQGLRFWQRRSENMEMRILFFRLIGKI